MEQSRGRCEPCKSPALPAAPDGHSWILGWAQLDSRGGHSWIHGEVDTAGFWVGTAGFLGWWAQLDSQGGHSRILGWAQLDSQDQEGRLENWRAALTP